MEKAYELKALVEEMKSQGLEVAESGAVAAINAVFSWLEKSAQMSSFPYDDIALVVYPKIKAYALEQADKIDGQVG